MEKKVLKIKEVPSDQKYWFFRTEAGTYFPDFYLNEYIAYGWDDFNNLDDLKEALQSEKKKNLLKEDFKKKYPEEKREGLAVNQMLLFIDTMSIGDIVLIPSAGGEQLAIGVIKSDAYIYKSPCANIDEDFDDEERGYKTCPYLKRRNIKWIKTIRKNNLDPHLYKLMFARNTISDASSYDMYIDREMYPIYLKDRKIYISLRVEQKEGISALDMSNLLSSSLSILHAFGDEKIKPEIDSLEVKMMVESPGVIQFIGGAAAGTMLLGAISLFAFGADIDFEVWGQKYSIQSNGAVQSYIDYKKEEHRHEEMMEQEKNNYNLNMKKIDMQTAMLKKSLEQLQVTAPEELKN